MSFFKHVGECNGKKVVIVNRTLPNEDHMAGVIYSEIIPSKFHDDLMKVLESTEGQAANEFVEVLKRRYFANGENMLEALHSEGFIKKAATNNIIVKPNSKSTVRLDELNRLLTDIATGKNAEKEIAKKAPEVAPVNESADAKNAGDSDRLDRLEKMIASLTETVSDLANNSQKKKSKTSV